MISGVVYLLRIFKMFHGITRYYTQYVAHSTIATGHKHHVMNRKAHHGLLVFRNNLRAHLGLREVKRGMRGNCL